MTDYFLKFRKALHDFLGMHNFKCICCGKDVFSDRRAICDDCEAKLEYNNKKSCARCGKPVLENLYCGACAKSAAFYDKAYSVLIYDGLARKAMLSFKFGGMKYIANTFAQMLAEKAIKENIRYDAVTFVPVTPKDYAKRGYNQTRLLATKFCDILGSEPPEKLLSKVVQTEKQEKLGYKERMENIKNAFAVTDKKAVKGKTILLIDDVMTSGATVNECARMLKKSGASKVYVLTVATRVEKLILD